MHIWVAIGGSDTGISQRNLGDSGGSDHFGADRFTVHDSVESVDGISGVLDGTTGAIGLNERIRSLDDISASGLVLVLGVSGEGVLHVVAETVLRIGIVVGSDNSLGNNWGGVFGNGRVSIGGYSDFGIGAIRTGVGWGKGWGGVRVHGNGGGACHEGSEDDELRKGRNSGLKWILGDPWCVCRASHLSSHV